MDDSEFVGRKFGDLTVLGWFGDRDSDNRKAYKCQCICGNICYGRKTHIVHGNIVSCGCKKKREPPGKTHGMSGTRIHRIWLEMRERCREGNSPRSKDYYDRGIRVCDEWDNIENGFENFARWAFANGYQDNLSIDRIDNDGNYTPGNCRWATNEQQARNKRSNHILTLNGESHTIIEWSEITGIKYKTLMTRVRKGLSTETILTAPVGNRWKWDENLVNG